MKHIGWCLDHIQMTMMNKPKAINSTKEKSVAEDIITDIEKYAKTLTEIIHNNKFKKYLSRLEKSSIEGVQLQAHEIEALVKDLEHMLQVLDLYIENLKQLLAEGKFKEWCEKADQITLMIDQKFGGERGELRREFQVALHTEDELKEMVSSEEHLAEFLK